MKSLPSLRVELKEFLRQLVLARSVPRVHIDIGHRETVHVMMERSPNLIYDRATKCGGTLVNKKNLAYTQGLVQFK